MQSDHNQRFKSLRNRLAFLFLIAGSILTVTIISVNYRIEKSLDQESDISSLINIAGRQRMLSQRVTKLALMIKTADTIEIDDLHRELDTALATFKQSHEHLLKKNKTLQFETIDQKFESIQPAFDSLITKCDNILSTRFVDIESIVAAESLFLPSMDEIVKEYELLSNERFEAVDNSIGLSNYSIVVLVILFSSLAFLAVVRIVQRYSSELQSRSEALQEARVELEKSKVKEQFAFIASHDLQEPVRTIISLSELLEKEHGTSLNEDGKQMIFFIRDSGQRMARLIRGLLDYSRLGKNQELEPINTNQVLANVQKDLSGLIAETEARIESDNLPDIIGYRLDIYSLFQNLVSNAIKFRQKTQPLNITVSVTENSDFWKFQVADNGIGMAQKDTDKVFQLFKRLHRKDQFEGSGIGLAHCKRIVEIHRGDITVTSSLNVGSTFSFSISKHLT